MDDTGFDVQKGQPDRVPVGYVHTDQATEPIVTLRWELGSALYSGGLYSNVEDMARFLSLQFQARMPGGAQIISADGLRMMHLKSLGWGYVWDPTHRGIEHTGGYLGFHAYVRAYPGLKIGIVALTNSSYPLKDQHPCEGIARGVLSEFKKALLAPGQFNEEKVDLEKYIGVYTFPGAGVEMGIEFQDGRLRVILRQDPGFSHEIDPVEANAFGIDRNPEPWLFLVEDDMKGIRSLRFLGFTLVKNR